MTRKLHRRGIFPSIGDSGIFIAEAAQGLVTENLLARWEPSAWSGSGDWTTTSSPSLSLESDGPIVDGAYIRMFIDEEFPDGTSFGSAGPAEINFGANSVSASFWVKIEAFGNEGGSYVFDAALNAGQPGVALVFQNATTIYGFVQDVDTGSLSLTTTITDPSNAWHQFAIVANKDTEIMKIYRDGVEIGSGNEGTTLDGVVVTSNPWNYGKNSGGVISHGMEGLIGQLLMYNKALSPSEVLQNFNASKAYYGL